MVDFNDRRKPSSWRSNTALSPEARQGLLQDEAEDADTQSPERQRSDWVDKQIGSELRYMHRKNFE